jgi:hypothetical protein
MSSEKNTESDTASVSGADAAVSAWFGERLPTDWTATAPRITVDREEIIVILAVPAPESPASSGRSSSAESTDDDAEKGSPEAASSTDDAVQAARAEAIAGRIARFREETRDHRIAIAREAEHRFGRKVAWGVESGGTEQVFTSLAIPVMTRLRQSERLVLDTLVEAGVARSRAHGLAWCVRLVGDNAATWLTDLRSAMAEVEKVRDSGPSPTPSK